MRFALLSADDGRMDDGPASVSASRKFQGTSSKFESTTVSAITHDHATRSVAVLIGRRRRPGSHRLSKDAEYARDRSWWPLLGEFVKARNQPAQG